MLVKHLLNILRTRLDGAHEVWNLLWRGLRSRVPLGVGVLPCAVRVLRQLLHLAPFDIDDRLELRVLGIL